MGTKVANGGKQCFTTHGAQQIEACYNIMGIPQIDTCEMTGNVNINSREKSWRSKRVFFLTPQVMSNDLSRRNFPAEQVKLVIVDEAHRAQGDYAYCQVVRELVRTGQMFRVVASVLTLGNSEFVQDSKGEGSQVTDSAPVDRAADLLAMSAELPEDDELWRSHPEILQQPPSGCRRNGAIVRR